MELINVSEAILNKIHLLEKGRKELSTRSQARAEAIANYEKQVGIVMLKLRNNAIKTHEEYPCENLPATLVEKIARSICYQEKLNAEQADTEFKLAMKALDVIQSEVSCYQSLNRVQTEV